MLLQFQICRNLRALSAKSVFPNFKSSQKIGSFQVCPQELFKKNEEKNDNKVNKN